MIDIPLRRWLERGRHHEKAALGVLIVQSPVAKSCNSAWIGAAAGDWKASTSTRLFPGFRVSVALSF